MTQINLPQSSQSQNQAIPSPIAHSQPQNGIPVQPWIDDWGQNIPGNQPSIKRLTPQERLEMIEKVYMEVLDRRPDTRDINYYKYSTLSEDEIRKQLLSGKEHKQLIAEGRDYKKTKDRAIQGETRVRMLESQIKDQIEEFKQLSNILIEKNRYITQIREQLNNRYNFVKNVFEDNNKVTPKEATDTQEVFKPLIDQDKRPAAKPLIKRVLEVILQK